MFDLTIVDDTQNGRFYKDENGNYYPSVTNKTSTVVPKGDAFINWAFRQNSQEEAEEYRDKKGRQGTKVHKICESLAKGHKVDLSELNHNSVKKVQGYKNFWQKKQPKVIKLEFMIKSDKYKYAGTADMLAKIPDEGKEYNLVDLKTSSGLYLNHKLQIMMYMYALEEHNILDGENTSLHLLHLKHRTNKGYHLKEIEYDKELVHHFNKIYNHEMFKQGDLEPRFNEKLPREMEIEQEEDGGEFEVGDWDMLTE